MNLARQSQRVVTIGLLVWLSLSCAIAVSGWFERATAPFVALTVWSLTGVTLLACWKISAVKNWAFTVDLRWLVLLHLSRLVGFYFLFLGERGEMPSGFARPAGWGDITVAVLATALVVSGGTRNSSLLLSWNFLGLVDILFVVSSALRFGLRDWQSMHALREWPLSLLPIFLVPLIIASHVLIFVRALKRTPPA